VIEYFRADERGQLIGPISPSQFWSILMVVLGVALWIVMTLWEKKRKNVVPKTECEAEITE
jgi:prolipoprotein diacylglyceryltransferase